jgi:hypothetical protein
MYANMFSSFMQNPNMTADERSAALGIAQSFFGQMSQQNSSIPAFIPPWISNSNYWGQAWNAGK